MPVHDSDKHAIVLDIGHVYTKCGFIGETEPRVIIPTVQRVNQDLTYIYKYSDLQDLYHILTKFLHKIFFKYLLVNHRERRIVVVESLLCPTEFRETLAKVLFIHFEVPSVLFVPSHLVSIYTLGISTGLVIDVGYEESVVIPICEGVPIIYAWQAQPLGGKSIYKNLEALLEKKGKVQKSDGQVVPLPEVMPQVPEKLLEDMMVRMCFVTTVSRAKQIQEGRRKETPASPPFLTPPPSIIYPLGGDKNLIFDGSIREEATEILFETDNDMMTLSTMVLDAILACPVDCRVSLAENMIIIGGASMLPGFKSRLIAEIRELQNHPVYKHRITLKSLKVHRPPAKANYVAWLGGAILGATEAIVTQSISRDTYLQTNRIPDWINLADVGKDCDRTS